MDITVLNIELNLEKIPLSTAWLLSQCMEYRGKQELYKQQEANQEKLLHEKAIMQSVVSSNLIDEISVKHLIPILNGEIQPTEGPDKAIFGYKRILESIYNSSFRETFSSGYIAKIHKAVCSTGRHVGEYKKADDEFYAQHTIELMNKLCNGYIKSQLPPLLKVATFVFDFVKIQPFYSDNERVSRLLTTYLLLKEGFIVTWYISLEQFIENKKSEYHSILLKDDIVAWWTFLLSIIKEAYKELNSIHEQGVISPKTSLVRREALSFISEFAVAELAIKLPGISLSHIKKILHALKKEGLLTQSGQGRASRWRVKE